MVREYEKNKNKNTLKCYNTPLWVYGMMLNSNAIVTFEKELDIRKKAVEKAEKSSNELLHERDAIHKDLKKVESTSLFPSFQNKIQMKSNLVEARKLD